MPQTTYSVDHAVAIAGMYGDGYLGRDVTSFVAGEVIPPGRMCEVVAGKLRLAQGTGQDSATVAGVSLYQGVRVFSTGYQIGDEVPVLRKGRVWVEFVGTAPTELEDAKYSHSSTVATDRGKFTDVASASTAGSEVSSVVGKFRQLPAGTQTTTGIVQVDLDLPAT